MSYNGSGTFLINTAGQPVVTGTVISSTTFNTLTADLGTGLSTAITKDGQTTTTSRIPFIAGISSTLTTDSTSVGTGSIITSGGVGIAKALFVGTTANIAGAVTLGGAVAITSSSANALAVGLNGATNPAFNVDASTASSATGLNVKSAAAAGGVALSVTSSGSNEALTLNAKGTGTIGIGSVSTGAVTITPALAVTGIASFAAGSAAAPAITRTGDLDTGVYFPAANALGLSSGGTNAVYIDSSQNVGIGTSSPTAKLDVVAASFNGGPLIAARFNTANFRMGFGIANSNGFPFLGLNVNNAANDNGTFDISSWANRLRMDNGVFQFQTSSASGTAGNAITWSTYAYLDTSGNLGVGTTSPISTSISSGSVTANGVLAAKNYLSAHQTSAAIIQYNTNVSTIRSYGATAGSGVLSFNVGGGGGSDDFEAARIDSSGNLLVGTTSVLGTSAAGATHISGGANNTNDAPLYLRNPFSTAGRHWRVGPTNNAGFIIFNDAGTGQYMTYGTTSWTATSDERLKTNLIPIQNAVQKVSSLRAVTGRYKTDDEGVSRSFLIAQDVQAVLPEAVDVQDDEIQTLGLRYTEVIPLLVAAIKEQQALIQSLTTRLTALEAK